LSNVFCRGIPFITTSTIYQWRFTGDRLSVVRTRRG